MGASFYSSAVDWMEADLNVSLQSVVRMGQGLSRQNESHQTNIQALKGKNFRFYFNEFVMIGFFYLEGIAYTGEDVHKDFVFSHWLCLKPQKFLYVSFTAFDTAHSCAYTCLLQKFGVDQILTRQYLFDQNYSKIIIFWNIIIF